MPSRIDYRHIAAPRQAKPSVQTLLNQAEALTKLARTTWLTTILGSLYVWIAIAALRDIQLFLPTETLTLPILNIGISPGGFFFFAPLLLLSVFTHLHLTLIRLWRVYRQLGAHEGKLIDGLPVIDRVAPWMLNHVMWRNDRGFDWLAVSTAFFFGWMFTPLTIAAMSYRYLRAHDSVMIDYHAVMTSLAITMAVGFWLEKRQSLSDRYTFLNLSVAAIATLLIAFGLAKGASELIEARINFPSRYSFLSTNAQLFRAELSQKPNSWDSLKMARLDREIALLESCQDDPDQDDCVELKKKRIQGAAALAEKRLERSDLLTNVTPAPLGRVAASDGVAADQVRVHRIANDEKFDYCAQPAVIVEARDLRGADLRGAFLANGNIRCARLEGADMRESQLYAADLRWAQLTGANLREAQMQEAQFYLANLEEANLFEARLERANFRGAQMKQADLRGAQMEGAILIEARMEGANLRGARMAGANLHRARMEGAVLSRARMEGADLSEARMELANLSEARMEGANLFGAWMGGADLRGAQMEAADLSGARMAGTDLRGAWIEGADLRGAQMAGTDLRGAWIEGADLRGAQMAGADLRSAQMEGADLRGAAMEGADLSWAWMGGADLRGAQMEGAVLWRTRMEGALLSRANLKSAHLRVEPFHGSALRSVDLTQVEQSFPEEQLTSAFGDGSVALPEDVDWPDHWPREELDEENFFGRWRHFRESQDLPWPPPGKALEWLSEYESIPPDPVE